MRHFVTADTFFSRPDALNIGIRKEHFESVDHMDEILIKNWNNVVEENDEVVHLGNFCWDPINAEFILRNLNGNIRFMPAKYDGSLVEIMPAFAGTHRIMENMILYDKNLESIFSPWPMLDWPGKDKGLFHFHGNGIGKHITNLEAQYRINASIDNWNYAPLEIALIPDIISSLKR